MTADDVSLTVQCRRGMVFVVFCFFFQAEDGIRDRLVTGVQTCALPIFPTLGLGTWKIPNELAPQVVQDAIRIGYRHFDCACDYGNEPEVGAGIASALSDGLCTRDDLWITSKLWNTYHEPQHVRAACERSLRDLQVDEFDLYLVHFPIALAFVPFEERYPPAEIGRAAVRERV